MIIGCVQMRDLLIPIRSHYELRSDLPHLILYTVYCNKSLVSTAGCELFGSNKKLQLPGGVNNGVMS